MVRRHLLAGALAVTGIASILLWRTLRSGTPTLDAGHYILEGLPAELFFLDASGITERGPSRVIVVRLDGGLALVPHHFRDENLSAPMPIDDWARHLGAPFVFNAGLFNTTLNHLGWLKAHGRWLAPERHARFGGLLLSGPHGDAAWARIVDLEQAAADSIDRYDHAIQSMMLFDDRGILRVRDTEKAASRTVVAEDAFGRILILHVEGAVTLAALARWLLQQPLQLVRALNLDGGIEAQLAIRTPSLELTVFGQHGTGTTLPIPAADALRYPLPAVIAVVPHP